MRLSTSVPASPFTGGTQWFPLSKVPGLTFSGSMSFLQVADVMSLPFFPASRMFIYLASKEAEYKIHPIGLYSVLIIVNRRGRKLKATVGFFCLFSQR